MFNRIFWTDHIVEHPRTYLETENQDHSVTHTPAFGTVINEGTPQNAQNFNTMDEALAHIFAAFEYYITITQAELRDAQDRIETLEAQLSAMTS